MSLTLDDIRAAADRIRGQVERTPLRQSRTLSRITGADIWVKYENQQFTGSFKDRGALNRLSRLSPEERKRGVVTASAGNHAQALAYHAARMDTRAVIVMPRATPIVKVEQTRGFGAEVVLEGDTLDDALVTVDAMAREQNLIFVSAYNDYDIMAGQGTAALEIMEDAPDLDILAVPIGGAGLIAGMATAVKALKPDVKVIGAEAEMYPSFTARLRGEKAPIGGQTIAEGIAVKQVGDLSFGVAKSLVDEVLLVSEARLEEAVSLYVTVEKTVAEGAGAATLAAVLSCPEKFRDRKVVLVLSGGNIDSRLLASVLTRELVREHRIISLHIAGDDRPGALAKVCTVIGAAGGNIIEVAHNRLSLDLPAKTTAFDIMIETRDAHHSQEIVDALISTGYPPVVT
jgi:threonine dehydratase